MKRLILPLLLIGCAVLLTGASSKVGTTRYTTLYISQVGGCQYVLAMHSDGVAIVHHAACPNRSGHRDSAP